MPSGRSVMGKVSVLLSAACMGVASFAQVSAGETGTGRTTWPICGEWRRVPVKGEQHGHAEDIEVVSPTDAWMVTSLGMGGRNESHVYRWTGVRWSETPIPQPDAAQWTLTSIEAVGSNRAWAIGYREAKDQGPPVPLTARWDGARWHLVPVKIRRLSGRLEGLAVIPGSDRLLAVGSTGWGVQTLALRWDGHAWSRVPSPRSGGGSTFFHDATAAGGTVWAVGSWNPAGGGSRMLASRWTGTRWATTLGARGGLSVASGATARELWAGGWYERADRGGTALARLTPGRITVVRRFHRIEEVKAIAMVSPTDAWAVGSVWVAPDLSRPVALRRHGSRWRVAWAPTDIDGWFEAIAGTPNNLWLGHSWVDPGTHRTNLDTYHRC